MYKSILMKELRDFTHLNLLDVREQDEHQGGYIEGAILLPLSQLQQRFSELDQTIEYYVVCYSGSRSQMACAFLSEMGYNVVNVMGGMSAYRGELCHEM